MISNYDFSQIDNYDSLRKIQLTQLEVLKKIDKICNENGITYSIAYGSLLGAVRHGGFIPWDDDLDICMLRPDYEKFISIWKDDEMYLLQNKDTDADFFQSFTKIRKKNTAFVQETDIGKKYHKGVFVDIFPFDRVADGKLKRKKQKLNIMFSLVFTREFAPTKNGSLVNLASKLLLKITPKKYYHKLAKKISKKVVKYKYNNDLMLFDTCTFASLNKYFDADLFDNIVKIKFEDMEVSAFGNYDAVLTKIYGDYMKLPPKEDQTWFHHPVFVDLNKEYEE